MRQASSPLPPGRHLALTWGIPENYGGMTAAMLHRSRAFVRLGGVTVDVLTVDDRPDYPGLEARMRESGELIDGMAIRNVWDDLREQAPAAAGRPVQADAPLDPEEGDVLARDGGTVLLRERRSADGALIAADRFRRDGSLLATDRVVQGKRRIVAYDEDGAPVRDWASSWKLFRWWLDRVTGRSASFLIADSKTAARFIAGYRRENVVTVHLVHGGHRNGDRTGTLRASREFALRRAADFDAVVLLTNRQRDEFIADGLATGANVKVIPNGVALDVGRSGARERGAGVMLASLTDRKRVEHAALAAAEALVADERIRLDVYGEGEREQSVRETIREKGAEERIVLRGFAPDARRRFEGADFSLLTSTSEGLPLVLAEAMAAGCLPIAYDIRYGPADLISDGVDGYLVPDGDVSAMAARIVDLQRLPEARVEEMRVAARERAQDFSDEAVTRTWGRELSAALDSKRMIAVRGKSFLVRLRRRLGVLRRRLRG
ncbi:poly(glycerol-phosphate) alpha-glucosyltransferase [Microbacterium resistens]|uniref:Poly(Glycerol-phosphate) alpha-glucosyltransferase n=1 Tax=Microbacterium resistens TaxID=156977 RepID=A0ABU1S8I8_9MICO|nr:glycosyltransferase [Microbacterium resistens]MDR6865932.1 poly(glycerol-phosphate) alpha-glucosyltransferase [Microbacterium resistens]